ncbi:(2Fe-2S)-binding protein [Actinophytocola sediminis]
MPAADSVLSELGPFFAVRRETGPGPWRPLRDLLATAVLAERVGHVHTVLSRLSTVDVERRVAASTMSLGLFARLISPVLGAGVLGVPLPRPTLDDAWWQPVDQGPWPLTLTGADTEPSVSDLLTDVLTPLAEVLAQRYSLSRQILSGNITSAVFGAARMIGRARPDLAPAAREHGAALLAGPLAGTGELAGEFVRSSCCLYYRIPGGGYCGDCVLASG